MYINNEITSDFVERKSHLLYFTELIQLEEMTKNNSDWLSFMIPITGDMAVAFELERLGVDFIDEWNYLEPDEINHNRIKAYNMTKNWWVKCIDNEHYEGLPLVEAAHQDLVYPFEASLNASTVYSKIFKSYSINTISGYFLPPIPIIRTGPLPARKAVQSISQAILFYLAEARGIHINYLNVDSV